MQRDTMLNCCQKRLRGKPVPRIINPRVWSDYAKRFERTFGFKPQDPPAEPNWHASEKL